eukprot:TRINITY_DN38929_c0_g1_i1.p1 TRINITY_DN38929_c0_g1~~TRINITY_DN38929_c0_g1_i1.p1  ORF type:complete len:114 (+),score=14.28 TRINITY_DN38929_c0_g1_i1:34-342(+)
MLRSLVGSEMCIRDRLLPVSPEHQVGEGPAQIGGSRREFPLAERRDGQGDPPWARKDEAELWVVGAVRVQARGDGGEQSCLHGEGTHQHPERVPLAARSPQG